MQIEELRESLKKMEVKSSNKYISFMVQVCSKLNQCNPSHVTKVDIKDLQKGKSHLIFINIKNIETSLAIELKFISKLKISLQEMFLSQLNRYSSILSTEVKDILKKLNHAFNTLQKHINTDHISTLVDPSIFLKPIPELLEKASSVSGSGKIDLLFDALSISSEKRFDCSYLHKIISNPLDPSRDLILKSIRKISEIKNPEAYVNLLEENINVLQKQTDDIYTNLKMEFNININLDTVTTDIHTDWFKLDIPTESGEKLFQFIFNFKEDEDMLKQSFFEDKKEKISADNLNNSLKEILASGQDEPEVFSELIELFDQAEEAYTLSTNKESSLISTLNKRRQWDEIDENQYLSIMEWLETNGKKCQRRLLDIYNSLVKLKDKNSGLTLPPVIQQMYDNTLSIRKKELDEIKLEILNAIKQSNPEMVQTEWNEIRNRPLSNAESLKTLHTVIKNWETNADELSPSNIYLIEKIEYSFPEEAGEKIIIDLWNFSQAVQSTIIEAKNHFLKSFEALEFGTISDELYNIYINLKRSELMRELREMNFEGIDTRKLKEQAAIDDDKTLSRLCTMKDIISLLPDSITLKSEIDNRITRGELSEEDGQSYKQLIDENYSKFPDLRKDMERRIRDLIMKTPDKVSRDNRMSVYGLENIIPDRLEIAAQQFNRRVKRATSLSEIEAVSKDLKDFEELVIENQKKAETGGEFYKKIEEQLDGGTISDALANSLKQDISRFYSSVKKILNQIATDQKNLAIYLRKVQNRLTGVSHFDDESHHEMIIDTEDIEALDNIYSFLPDVSVERKKKFCKLWEMRRENILSFLKKNLDTTIHNQFISEEVLNNYDEKNILTTPTKTALYLEDMKIFDDECSSVLVGAELIDYRKYHHKKLFQNIISFFSYVLNESSLGKKTFNLFFNRMQELTNHYKPESHDEIYRKNSSRLLSEILKLF